MKKKKKKQSRIAVIVIPGVLIVAAGIFFLCTRSSGGDEACQDNVARLQKLEASDITQTEKALQNLKQQDKEKQIAQAQEEITDANSLLSDIQIKQVFQGSVIIGDSITESIQEYGFLDTDVVVSKRGLSISEADEQIATAIGLHPTTIFMAFGSNDLEQYGSDSKSFIDAYRVQTQKLTEALPDAPIYINGILPLTEAAIAAIPDLGYYSDYNDALSAFCEEMGYTYIDNAFIVNSSENMYEPDGEHVVRDYYPKWLTYMAETAGL